MKQQLPDLTRSIASGFEFAQNARLNNLKMLAAEQEIQQKQQLRSLYNLASSGDPQAVQQLSMVAPDAYKGLKDYQNYRLQRGGQLANGVLTAPLAVRPDVYKQAIQEYTKEFGQAPNVPAEYSPEAANHLKYIVNQAREVEDVAKEEFARPKQEADIASTKASTYKTYKDAEKTGLEIEALKTEQQAMKDAGFTSPTAWKEQQKEIGKAKGGAIVSLPQAQASANNAIKLLDDLTTHEGMSSMVGAKNILSGAATRFIPFMNKAIPGTQAANFQTKFEQLQGKQFLEAYEQLKGGGAISEAEGNKAQQAISDMSLAQTEAEFKKSAEELKSILRTGIERLKEQAGGSSQTPNVAPDGTIVRGKDGKQYIKRGGKWQTM